MYKLQIKEGEESEANSGRTFWPSKFQYWEHDTTHFRPGVHRQRWDSRYEFILQENLVYICPQIELFIAHDFLEIWKLFCAQNGVQFEKAIKPQLFRPSQHKTVRQSTAVYLKHQYILVYCWLWIENKGNWSQLSWSLNKKEIGYHHGQEWMARKKTRRAEEGSHAVFSSYEM